MIIIVRIILMLIILRIVIIIIIIILITFFGGGSNSFPLLRFCLALVLLHCRAGDVNFSFFLGEKHHIVCPNALVEIVSSFRWV